MASHRVTVSAQCHWTPEARDVCIVTSHWRVDGVGLVILAIRFLKVLSTRPSQGRDGVDDSFCEFGIGPLSPSLDDIVGSYTEEGYTPAHIRTTGDALVVDLVEGFPSIGLPMIPGKENAIAVPTRRGTASFDTPRTKAIVSACRVRGWSASLALHAAIVRVTASNSQHPLAKNYGALLAVDLKIFLSVPYRLEDYAVGMFASGIPIIVEDVVGKSFERAVAELGSGYRRDVTWICEDERSWPILFLELTAPYIHRTTELVATPPPPGIPPSQNPGLSSLGRLDKLVTSEYPIGSAGSRGRLVSKDIGIGMEALGRPLECHSWTFNGKLTLSACYDTSFHEIGFVEGLLWKVRYELLAGLGLVRKLRAKL